MTGKTSKPLQIYVCKEYQNQGDTVQILAWTLNIIIPRSSRVSMVWDLLCLFKYVSYKQIKVCFTVEKNGQQGGDPRKYIFFYS